MQMPSLDQVNELRGARSRSIPAEFADANGHLNVRNYLAVLDDAEWELFARIGFDADHVIRQRRGFFALEQHLSYAREIAIDDVVSVRMRLLGRSSKVLHLISYLVNETRSEVAAAMEELNGYADLETRRLTPFTDGPALEALDQAIALDQARQWAPDLSGCLRLR